MFLNVFMVFIGGGIGSVLRYLISVLFFKNNSGHDFPWATLFANVLACLVFAFTLVVLKQKINQTYGLLFATGFCGGLSTMSTFSVEVMRLIAGQNYMVAFSYVFLSLILCFGCFALVYNTLQIK